MAASSRESRRKKILERGSDRFALITGRFPSSSSDPSQSHHEPETGSPQPLISYETHLVEQTTVSTNDENKVEDDVSGSTMRKQDPALDTGHTSAYYKGKSVESPLPECGTSTEPLRASASEVNGKVQSSLVSSTDRTTSVSASNKEQKLESQRCQYRLFTPSQISFAISATEHARLFCSAAVALLVVLSHFGFPLLGSTIVKSIISFRPLYLVLLTNLTIVLSRLLFNNQGRFQRTIREYNNIPSTDAYGWAEQASKYLEVGWLVQKVIDTVLLDCSVYAIIVVCGLSFG